MNCIKFQSESSPIPSYDFGGSRITFQFSLPSRKPLLVHMSPCKNPREMITIYDKAGGAMRALEGDEVDLLGSDMSVCRPFFYKQFQGLSDSLGKPLKTPATQDAQLDWIKSHPSLRIPETVVMQGMFSLEVGSEEGEDEEDFFGSEPEGDLPVEFSELGESEDESEGLELDLSGEDFSKVESRFSAVDEDTSMVVKVPITWNFTECTERENLAWQRATGQSRMHTRKRTIKRRIDHFSVLKLFVESVIEAEGAFLNGKPCTAENKSEWVGAVNYGWVYTLMSYRFRTVSLKNE